MSLLFHISEYELNCLKVIACINHCISDNHLTQVVQMVKHLPTMRETRVQFLGWEDPLEKEMAVHFSTLVWKIPRTEEPGGLQSMGSQRVGHN